MDTTMLGLYLFLAGASILIFWLSLKTIQTNRKVRHTQSLIDQKNEENRKKDYIENYETKIRLHKSFWIGGNCYEIDEEHREEYDELTQWLNDNFGTYWDLKYPA